ncbi:unnamed protein product [Rhizophagus irregularis]|nr:unnamed protein product [Rhizophagus irregularis]
MKMDMEQMLLEDSFKFVSDFNRFLLLVKQQVRQLKLEFHFVVGAGNRNLDACGFFPGKVETVVTVTASKSPIIKIGSLIGATGENVLLFRSGRKCSNSWNWKYLVKLLSGNRNKSFRSALFYGAIRICWLG